MVEKLNTGTTSWKNYIHKRVLSLKSYLDVFEDADSKWLVDEIVFHNPGKHTKRASRLRVS